LRKAFLFSLLVTSFIFLASNITTLLKPQKNIANNRNSQVIEIILERFQNITDISGCRVEKNMDERYFLSSFSDNSIVTITYDSFFNEKYSIGNKSVFSDEDDDGFPDQCEIYGEDAKIFRDWFVHIALNQKISYSPLWRHRDCSGLVRFSYREALKNHNNDWLTKSGITPIYLEDVKAYNYPEVPVIGVNLFYDGKNFLSFADARHLFLYNTERVSRDLNEKVKKGDLIFFYHPQDIQFPYHVMIYTGDGFIYHTGPSEDDDGNVRLWKYADYLKAAPLTWLPVKENPNFLGYYRFKILND